MSVAPKILPLVAVAAVGVLAAKGLSNAQLLPQMFAPKAVAEEARPAARPAPAKPGGPAPAAAPGGPPPPAPICQRSPADLARDAGLSPAELATLQNLGARRGQLDAREQALDTQLQLLNAASAKLDGKLKTLGDLKAQIQALTTQASQQSQSEVDHLVLVYEKMKPRDAGALMAALDDKVRVPVAAKIAETKPAVMAAILSQMGTAEGKKLTELLAHRFTPGMTLQEALNGPAGASALKPPAAAATEAATTVASATAEAGAPAKPPAAAAKPRRPRPVKTARRTPPRPAPAAQAAQAPAAPAKASAVAAKPVQTAGVAAPPAPTAVPKPAAPAAPAAPAPAKPA